MTRFSCVLLFALAAAGCSSSSPVQNQHGNDGGTDGSTPVVTGISLSPQDPRLDIQGSTPATQAFTVTARYDDGHTADVSAQATFAMADATLGSFAQQDFTSTTQKGGTTRVTARFSGQVASTGLTLVKHQTFTAGTGFPSDPSVPFSGPADATRNPSLVYPNDGVLLPPNLGRLEIHFRPQNASELFQLSFENAITDVKVYLNCGTAVNGGCIYLPDDAVWKAIATGNRGGDPVTVAVKEADAAGTGVGTSNAISISFSHDDLQGGLYYWTTSNGTGVMRFDFASTQTSAQPYIGPNATGGKCIGCHALSRDGSKLVAEANGQSFGGVLLWSVKDSAPLVAFNSTPASMFESWNPDGSQYVGVYSTTSTTNNGLMLFDGNSGQLVSTIPNTGDSAHPADHPDWSADGQSIVFTQIGIPNTAEASTNQRPYQGAIQKVTRLADGGWSAPQTLVAAASGKNHYYPSFSPDDQWVTFDESTCPSGKNQDVTCDADSDPSATLFLLPADGGTPIPLARANAPGVEDGTTTALTNSFPKWSPFVTQRSNDPASRVMWLTFSSTRHYGVRSLLSSSSGESDHGSQVWMVAIDPAKAAAGQDPSYPAFALPFQDPTTSNHIAQWSTQVVEGVCLQQGATCDASGGSGQPCCSGLSCQLNTGDPPVATCEPVIN